jgi:hypothetical protein
MRQRAIKNNIQRQGRLLVVPMQLRASFLLAAILFWTILLVGVSSLPYDSEHAISVDRQIYASRTTSTDYYDEEDPIITEDDIFGGTSTTSTSPKHSIMSGSSSVSSYRGRGSSMDATASGSEEQPSSSHSAYSSSSTTGSTLKYPYKSSSSEEHLQSDYYTSMKKSHSNKGGFFRGSSSHFRWKQHFHFRPIHYIFGSFFTVLVFFGGATFVTAYQVLEQPSGCYATTCRRAIQCFKCILSLFTKGITYTLWGHNERWEGFESCDTDFEEEENIPRLRPGIGRALEREHTRSINLQQQQQPTTTVKSETTPYSSSHTKHKNTNYTTRRGFLELSSTNP